LNSPFATATSGGSGRAREHKLARGYRPVVTHSAHEFADPRLSEAVAAFLEREHVVVDSMIGEYEAFLRFVMGEAGADPSGGRAAEL